MTLRDIMTAEKHVVTEHAGSRRMQIGDLMFGQLASVDGLTMLEANNGFVIPPHEKAPIVELRARIASANPVITHEVLRDMDLDLLDLFHDIADRSFNPQQPTLLNTDSEPISPHKLVFDLNAPPQAAFDALKHLALDEPAEALLAGATRDAEGKLTRVRFSWKKRGNAKHVSWDNTVLGSIEIDGARLIVEVNSQARADTIRKTIEAALGKGVRYRAAEILSTEKLLAEARGSSRAGGGASSKESERLAQSPEVREKISTMMAAHWEDWVDQPIPVLGNRTPAQAVMERDGREIVESLVIEAERTGTQFHTDPAVFRRLRERLGLAGGRS